MEQSLGKRIAMLRRQKGLKQDDLANALNAYRRTHKEWVFVEVTSAKGEYVQIKL